MDNDDETTKCGYIPEQKRFIGHNVNINFVSDKYDTEMGFWLRFSGKTPISFRDICFGCRS